MFITMNDILNYYIKLFFISTMYSINTCTVVTILLHVKEYNEVCYIYESTYMKAVKPPGLKVCVLSGWQHGESCKIFPCIIETDAGPTFGHCYKNHNLVQLIKH